jgi:hypothetical protein
MGAGTDVADGSPPDERGSVVRDVSLFRLYLLRATYLLLVVGLGIEIWPGVLHHSLTLPLMNSVVRSLLAAVAVLALLGLRYPLQMLPLLLFEMVWKTIWLVAFALPLARAHQIDANTHETVIDTLSGIIFPIVIPWGYVFANYVRRPADRWK